MQPPSKELLDRARKIVDKWAEAPIVIGDFSDLEAAIARALEEEYGRGIDDALRRAETVYDEAVRGHTSNRARVGILHVVNEIRTFARKAKP